MAQREIRAKHGAGTHPEEVREAYDEMERDEAAAGARSRTSSSRTRG